MHAGTHSERPAAENIDEILRLEMQDEETLAVHHRLFHRIGWFVGTIQFIFFSVSIRYWLDHL